ncbi:MAG: hypothetical protein F6K22_10860 [Okeania sp. SIO2F4]|uniref:hypothetical protein n=1 Tax=Okeania sp. SIO2F4 TaxID=2607790 RepID=UPI001428D923|nr:hypothetical protein [Okeania sp. SIO2F4]NES03302.1 hypothetical protein [Okeania sp. SIO2F4]
MNFPVKAREGKAYKTPYGQTVTVSDTMKKISNPNTQSEALGDLGITINNYQLKIEFSETGNPYAEPDGDRTRVSDTSTQTVTVELILDAPPPLTLKLQTQVSPFTQDSVNFFGWVRLETPDGEVRSIPMTGRGTVALEGKESGDIHAGIVTGGACACFQQRAALVLAVAAATGAKSEQLDEIGEKLHTLNDSFHGRGEMLDYTVEAAKTSQDNMPSYTKFMADRYPESQRSTLLQSVIERGKPNAAFYEKVLTKMTEEELAIDRETE